MVPEHAMSEIINLTSVVRKPSPMSDKPRTSRPWRCTKYLCSSVPICVVKLAFLSSAFPRDWSAIDPGSPHTVATDHHRGSRQVGGMDIHVDGPGASAEQRASPAKVLHHHGLGELVRSANPNGRQVRPALVRTAGPTPRVSLTQLKAWRSAPNCPLDPRTR